MPKDRIETRIRKRIARRQGAVFMRKDFSDLGGYDQVGRVLRGLTRAGVLLKIGHGLYTRAEPSRFTGEPVPVIGIRQLATETLGRLGITTVPTASERRYNGGLSTQVPTGRVVAVTKRVRRKIGWRDVTISFERALAQQDSVPRAALDHITVLDQELGLQ